MKAKYKIQNTKIPKFTKIQKYKIQKMNILYLRYMPYILTRQFINIHTDYIFNALHLSTLDTPSSNVLVFDKDDIHNLVVDLAFACNLE